MRHPILKCAFSAGLCLCLMEHPLHAQTGPNMEPIQVISSAPDLKLNAAISMPTTAMRGRDASSRGTDSRFAGVAAASPAASPHPSLRYPADLQNHGGPTIDSATQHTVFVNPSSSCPPNSCWGDPIGFLDDLSNSQFINVTNQYVGANAPDRYPDGANYFIPNYAPSAGKGKPFTDLDLAIAAYSAASLTGSFGYNHIYHVFLAPGQDVCFDNTFSQCYSPDNNNTFYFCAYHNAVQDGAGNLVLYTVEPFQNVSGCNVRPGTPNGQLADSTNNVLSHETFETITDPIGSGWWNQLNNGIFGEEIGDECAFLLFTNTAVYFDPSTARLNRKLYAAQPEYSNAQHACSTGPSN